MSPLTFSLGDIVGSVLWVGVVGGGGYAVGHISTVIFDGLRAHPWWIADVVFLGAVILFARHGRDLPFIRALRGEAQRHPTVS
jgi:membrane protein DedA with SNARE-associated domain